MAQNTLADELDNIINSMNISKSGEYIKNEQHFAAILQAFSETPQSDDKETRDVIKQWENYLFSVTGFTNTEYIKVLNTQLRDYCKAIVDFEDNLKKNKIKRKNNYSSLWVDGLVSRFGIEFVKKNRNTIIDCIWAVVVGLDKGYEQQLKNLMYTETMLFGSYRDYFEKFIDFYLEELDQKDQKKVEPRKKIAENFLAIIGKTSIASVYETNTLKLLLTENMARQLNEEVFLFLKKHPLSYTFKEITKVLDDLKKVTDK